MMLSQERRNLLGLKAEHYAESLGSNGEAAAYLNSRGITEEVAHEFRIGVVGHDNDFEGRLSIPYLTTTGVVDIKYRCINPAHGDHRGVSCSKYGKESGLGVHLYNARALIGNADRVVLTEGEFDAVSVWSLAGYPAVGYPGVDTWTKQEHWRLCFDSVSEVVIIADGDDPGRKAAERVANSFSKMDLLARVVEMPNGHDANSFLITYGIPEFQKRVEN